MPNNSTLKKILEWFGVITAIFYSMLVASNTGFEVLGFSLLFISALAIGLWALLCKHYGILLLQFFIFFFCNISHNYLKYIHLKFIIFRSILLVI